MLKENWFQIKLVGSSLTPSTLEVIMKSLYFGHSRMYYGTEEEKRAIEILKEHFPKYKIVNPNIPEHQKRCRYSIDGKYLPGKEIGYFLDLTGPTEFGCFLQYYSEKWSAGSSVEMIYMRDAGKKLFLIDLETESIKLFTGEIKSQSFKETSNRLGKAGIKHLM